MIRRHGVPATLTSTGRVSHTWLPGEADRLTGWRRWWEVCRRFRHHHGWPTALRLTAAAWRHGVTLSGPAMTTTTPREDTR
jgi:hypothetical protein